MIKMAADGSEETTWPSAVISEDHMRTGELRIIGSKQFIPRYRLVPPLHHFSFPPLHRFTASPLHRFTTSPLHHFTTPPSHPNPPVAAQIYDEFVSETSGSEVCISQTERERVADMIKNLAHFGNKVGEWVWAGRVL
jgi:hypothetical protein